jgi:hypothetical protein
MGCTYRRVADLDHANLHVLRPVVKVHLYRLLTMSIRPFVAATGTCVAALILINIAMIMWSQRLPYRRKLDNIRRSSSPDLVFVGDSLLDTRVDPAALNRGAARKGGSFFPVNAALVSTLPPDQVLLADYAVQLHPGIKTMAVGVMDFILTKDVRLRPMDLTGNHAVGVFPFFPISMVAQVNQWGSIDRFELRLLRFFPMFANRMNAWQYIEVMRRGMAQMGMPPEAKNTLGRVRDMFGLEAASGEEFDQEAQSFLKDPQHFNRSYEIAFAIAQQKKINVVLVIMPMSQEHRTRFYSRASWQQYLRDLLSLAERRRFVVIDASGWLPEQSSFLDGIHMSGEGAIQFSDRLGDQLASLDRK